jgi:hypothetical protein
MSEQQTPGQEPAATPANTVETDPWAAFPKEFNWVRKELEDTRKEAAEKRVLNKDLQDKLAQAKSPEEVQQATAAYETKARDLEIALTREKVARKTGLSDDLVEFLTAKSEEELVAQAEKLAGLKPAANSDPVVVTVQEPRGGLDPSLQPNDKNGFDAWEEFKKNRH